MLALVALLLAAQQPYRITKERVEAVLKEVRPIVEKATGVTFESDPPFRISTPAELAAIIAEELMPQMAALMPNETERARKIQAGRWASAQSRSVLGKYAIATRALHFIPENFVTWAADLNKTRVHSADYIRVVAIHSSSSPSRIAGGGCAYGRRTGRRCG